MLSSLPEAAQNVLLLLEEEECCVLHYILYHLPNHWSGRDGPLIDNSGGNKHVSRSVH